MARSFFFWGGCLHRTAGKWSWIPSAVHGADLGRPPPTDKKTRFKAFFTYAARAEGVNGHLKNSKRKGGEMQGGGGNGASAPQHPWPFTSDAETHHIAAYHTSQKSTSMHHNNRLGKPSHVLSATLYFYRAVEAYAPHRKRKENVKTTKERRRHLAHREPFGEELEVQGDQTGHTALHPVQGIPLCRDLNR